RLSYSHLIFSQRNISDSMSTHPLWLALNRKIGNRKSLDQLGRSGEHLWRNRHADLLRRLEIDHELKLRRLLDRKIGRLGSLQNPVHVICDAPVALRLVRPVGHEPTGIYE